MNVLQEADRLPADRTGRTNTYFNNLIAQDQRRIKQRVRLRLGGKRFDYATVTLAGIEVASPIKKHHFNLSPISAPEDQAPQVWAALLAA